MSTADWQRLALIGVCASAAVFLGWGLWMVVGFLAPVLGLFFGGWLLACVQEPIIGWLMGHTRVRRSGAVAVTILTIAGGILAAGFLAAPTIQREVASTVKNLPTQLDTATQQIVATEGILNGWLADQGAPLRLEPPSSSALDLVAQQVTGGSNNPLTAANEAIGAVGTLGVILLLSVFFLLGGPQLSEQVISTFGGRAKADMSFVLSTVHDSFEGFVRAQLLQAVLFGAGVWACLAVAHVQTAPLVGALAGVMLLVPMVGSALAVALPVLATLVWNPPATLVVAVVLVLLEQLVLNVIGPRVMGRQVGLPPLLVLFGILAGGQVAGFWGAIFGIPVLATLVTCLEHFRVRWQGQCDVSTTDSAQQTPSDGLDRVTPSTLLAASTCQCRQR